jgi:predicted DNA-binding mobile mystery protein A
MSSRELGERLGVSQQTVAEFETTEERGTIQFDTLERVADALECDLRYYLIPRRDLETTVRARALEKARRHLSRISHHSRLEDQQLEEFRESGQLQDLVDRYIDRRGLWSDTE